MRFRPGRRSGRGWSRPRCRRNDRYCSASFCPSNTVGWQAWLVAASAAQSRAAMLALGSGPAISRSSTAPGFWPSRIAMIGRRPSNSAGWLVFRFDQSVRRPSIEVLRRRRPRTRSWSRRTPSPKVLRQSPDVRTRRVTERARGVRLCGKRCCGRRGRRNGGDARARQARAASGWRPRAGSSPSRLPDCARANRRRASRRSRSAAVPGSLRSGGAARLPDRTGGWRAAAPSRLRWLGCFRRDQRRKAADAGFGARRQHGGQHRERSQA